MKQKVLRKKEWKVGDIKRRKETKLWSFVKREKWILQFQLEPAQNEKQRLPTKNVAHGEQKFNENADGN